MKKSILGVVLCLYGTSLSVASLVPCSDPIKQLSALSETSQKIADEVNKGSVSSELREKIVSFDKTLRDLDAAAIKISENYTAPCHCDYYTRFFILLQNAIRPIRDPNVSNKIIKILEEQH